jgi:hypothetical protein
MSGDCVVGPRCDCLERERTKMTQEMEERKDWPIPDPDDLEDLDPPDQI